MTYKEFSLKFFTNKLYSLVSQHRDFDDKHNEHLGCAKDETPPFREN